MFTKEQIELIAKYYAVSNTGLIGILVPKPEIAEDIIEAYRVISYEYKQNTGEDLEEELKMWKEEIEDEPGEMLSSIKERIPFVLGGKQLYEVTCTDCKEIKTVEVFPIDYLLWGRGANVQNVMPYLNVDDRELLISKICPQCWDIAFS